VVDDESVSVGLDVVDNMPPYSRKDLVAELSATLEIRHPSRFRRLFNVCNRRNVLDALF